jgi:hypothetical protein
MLAQNFVVELRCVSVSIYWDLHFEARKHQVPGATVDSTTQLRGHFRRWMNPRPKEKS